MVGSIESVMVDAPVIEVAVAVTNAMALSPGLVADVRDEGATEIGVRVSDSSDSSEDGVSGSAAV